VIGGTRDSPSLTPRTTLAFPVERRDAFSVCRLTLCVRSVDCRFDPIRSRLDPDSPGRLRRRPRAVGGFGEVGFPSSYPWIGGLPLRCGREYCECSREQADDEEPSHGDLLQRDWNVRDIERRASLPSLWVSRRHGVVPVNHRLLFVDDLALPLDGLTEFVIVAGGQSKHPVTMGANELLPQFRDLLALGDEVRPSFRRMEEDHFLNCRAGSAMCFLGHVTIR
jgi:hypothetical protein